MGGCVTLGDRADVEIHDLSPCEGLRVLELYFCRHFSCDGEVGVWQEPRNQTNLVTVLGSPPIATVTSVGRYRLVQGWTSSPLYRLVLLLHHVTPRFPPRYPTEPSGRNRHTADSRVPQRIGEQESDQGDLAPGTQLQFSIAPP